MQNEFSSMNVNRIEKSRQQLLAEGKKIIDLSSGNPGECGIFFPQQILQKGFDAYAKNPAYHPQPKGALPAREAVAQYYQQRNFSVDPEQIILTSGTSESYLHLFKLLAKPGEEILFPNPCYPLFEHLAKLASVQI